MDKLIGLVLVVTTLVRQLACGLAIDSASFQRAAEHLRLVGGLRMSDELLRQLVENEGKAARAFQDEEQLGLDFDAAECQTKETPDGQPVSRGYVGMDGFMAPTVTQAECDKRHQKAVERRKTLPRIRGKRRKRLVCSKGTDQPYKEVKLVIVYDQALKHRRVQATIHGPDKVKKILRNIADDVCLFRAKQVVAVTDGAPWIGGVIGKILPDEKTTVILDFFHAAEHVKKAANVIYGEASEEGRAWSEKLVDRMRHDPFSEWYEDIAQLRSKLRSPAKRAAVDALTGYLWPRREHAEYAQFKAKGFMIGSGPTESACKSEGRRLKGPGMRWKLANIQSMLALESLRQSDLWNSYWQSRFAENWQTKMAA